MMVGKAKQGFGWGMSRWITSSPFLFMFSCGFQASTPSACSGGLQSLSFCDNFNQSVEGIELPAGLESLKFGGCFNQKIDKVRGKPSSVMGKYQKKQYLDFRPWRVVSDTLVAGVVWHTWRYVLLYPSIFVFRCFCRVCKFGRNPRVAGVVFIMYRVPAVVGKGVHLDPHLLLRNSCEFIANTERVVISWLVHIGSLTFVNSLTNVAISQFTPFFGCKTFPFPPIPGTYVPFSWWGEVTGGSSEFGLRNEVQTKLGGRHLAPQH